MFIDPSMGGSIYNPWRSNRPTLLGYNQNNPAYQGGTSGSGSLGIGQGTGGFAGGSSVPQSTGTSYRFFGGQQPLQMGQNKTFRSFF